MKKLVVTMLCTFASIGVYALPVGNIADASLYTNGLWYASDCADVCDPCFNWCDAWSVRIGFYGNYVFNRNFELRQTGESTPGTNGNGIDRTTVFTNSGILVLNICNRLDCFATLGATRIAHEFNENVLFGTNNLCTRIECDNSFSWSVGGRATLWECNCFLVGLEGEYFRTSPNLGVIYNSEYFYNLDRFTTTYTEWQVGLGGAYRIASTCPEVAFVPYVAVTWSGAKVSAVNNVNLDGLLLNIGRLKNSKLWGFAVGTSLTLHNVIGVTVEGRFGNETAIYVGSQVRF